MWDVGSCLPAPSSALLQPAECWVVSQWPLSSPSPSLMVICWWCRSYTEKTTEILINELKQQISHFSHCISPGGEFFLVRNSCIYPAPPARPSVKPRVDVALRGLTNSVRIVGGQAAVLHGAGAWSTVFPPSPCCPTLQTTTTTGPHWSCLPSLSLAMNDRTLRDRHLLS